MSYIKIQKIKKNSIESSEKNYIYFGCDDGGIWIKKEDGSSYYILYGYSSYPSIIGFDTINSHIGDTLIINGINFVTNVTSVTFNNVLVTSVSVLSSTQLSVMIPTTVTAGDVPIFVSTCYGLSQSVSHIILN